LVEIVGDGDRGKAVELQTSCERPNDPTQDEHETNRKARLGKRRAPALEHGRRARTSSRGGPIKLGRQRLDS
jgi:hypothetical protein